MISNEKVDHYCRQLADATGEQHDRKIIGHVHFFMVEPEPGKSATIVLTYIPDEYTTIRNALLLQGAMINWVEKVVLPAEEAE